MRLYRITDNKIMKLFKNKYRIESSRLTGWDYSSDGEYFVTICTKKMRECFGEIKNGIMGLNEIGNVAAICWQQIPSHFPFVELGAWVVMPNHVHGVIIINKSENGIIPTTTSSVETQNLASLQNADYSNKFGPQSKNLASIIRGFKIGVTKYAKSHNIDFQWQSRFYDHVIFGELESEMVNNYILDNPRKWENDRDNSENLWM